MGNVLNFKTRFELELSKEMRKNGFSEDEIKKSLQFVKENPLNNGEDEPTPPSKKMKKPENAPISFKTSVIYRKAA